MLRIDGLAGSRDCDRTTRRDFLRIGGLGLGGLTLPALLQTRAAAAESGSVRNKSVVFLFLCGGASQIETFDPKMTAAEGCRSATGEVKTALPGITFGGTYPELAAMADRLAIVRSYTPHGESDHAKAIRKVFTVDGPTGAGMGSIYGRFRNQPLTPDGMPTSINLIEQETDPEYQQDQQRMTSSNAPGTLGPGFAPFNPSGEGQLNQDMRLGIPLERLESRRQMLAELDRLNRAVDATGEINAMDRYEQQAVDLLLGGAVRKALDLSDEDPRLIERYDTSRFDVGHQVKRKSTLGQRMLLARRLCEAGAGFVTVGSAGWDNHANDRHPNMVDGMERLGRPLDQAVSAFLKDVQQRGLSDDILLVIATEFGRTPKMNNNGGRDHWPGLCPLVFAGGGLPMGQVIGESDPRASAPRTRPYRMQHMFSTIFHTLLDVGQLRLERGMPGRLLSMFEQAPPIPELV